MTTLALAGDTMLGRRVADALRSGPAAALFEPALLERVQAADGTFLNLECCISERGEPWPGRVFHFRAPPVAVDVLRLLGVRCVTLANNHALDYGPDALMDTLEHLRAAGIAVVGAGADRDAARAPRTVQVGSLALTVVAFSDDPEQYAAGPDAPGIAHADVAETVPDWLRGAVSDAPHPLLVSPHWGPNMTAGPLPYVRRTAEELLALGATLVAGHSAHVFHGVARRTLFDLGDFVDDYAVDPVMRNDLGVLWLVTFDGDRPVQAEAVPLSLDYCRTRLATSAEAREVAHRFRLACERLGTAVEPGPRLVVPLG